MTNYLDVDELAAEREDLADRRYQDESSMLTLDADELERLTALDELFDFLPQGVQTLIPESEFTDYARDWAEDVYGDFAADLGTYVDWDAFATAMKVDYQSIEFDGGSWLYRS